MTNKLLLAALVALSVCSPAFAARQTIAPGASPAIVWGRVQSNFAELYVTASATQPCAVLATTPQVRRWSCIVTMVNDLNTRLTKTATILQRGDLRPAVVQYQQLNAAFTNLYGG
jgi:hypothetical protein